MASQSSSLPEVPDIVRSIVWPGLQPRPWVPGVSGNPGGRPSYRIMSDALTRKLEEAPNPDKPAERRADIIAENVVVAAEKGDVQAFTAIRDTVDGRPAQQIDLNANLLVESSEERKNRMLAVLTALATLGQSPDE